MIQRAQTLYILIALGLMIAFLFMPFGYVKPVDIETNQSTFEALKALNFTGLVIPTAICLLTLVIAFLSFSNLNAQKIFTGISCLLSLACVGVVIYILSAGMYDTNPAVKISTEWGGGGFFLIGAAIAEIAAFVSISSDQRKLRASNRLR
ncbi:MAG: DUF4293 family protein [Paramuribaculum sp.]|nr:DUF4293 family protein [Paramuribaculum sp.]